MAAKIPVKKIVAPIPAYLAASEGTFSSSVKLLPEHNQKNLFILFTSHRFITKLVKEKKKPGECCCRSIGIPASKCPSYFDYLALFKTCANFYKVLIISNIYYLLKC